MFQNLIRSHANPKKYQSSTPEDDLINIQKKYRSFANYLGQETGFINTLVLDILWKSVLLKVDEIIC
jgi:hypothetical protein